MGRMCESIWMMAGGGSSPGRSPGDYGAVCVALERLANKVYDGEYVLAYRKVS
jgi:hypothetical protein